MDNCIVLSVKQGEFPRQYGCFYTGINRFLFSFSAGVRISRQCGNRRRAGMLSRGEFLLQAFDAGFESIYVIAQGINVIIKVCHIAVLRQIE